MGEKAPSMREWLPTFARGDQGTPEWVQADLNAGIELGLVSQGLYDALQDLDG